MFNKLDLQVTYDKTLDIQLQLDEWIQLQIYFRGYYDKNLVHLLKNELKEGDVFIDIGANIGAFTLLAAKQVGKSGKVIAFEPVSDVMARLVNNVELNSFEQVVLEQKAVSDENKELTLYLSGDTNSGMSSIYRHDTESGLTENVPAVTLDRFLQDHPLDKINLIKIDIEGAEYFALKGMTETLKKYKPSLVLELLSESESERAAIQKAMLDLLKDLNYKQFGISEQGTPVEVDAHSDYYNYLFIPIK
ncbi:FkbM family methyltransferase [Paracrocinitomix mangrovi]|uniref:FkbM family methyltransferase n=1 Tax=Paracrocinitomix mangrovi TaxID=2862509 RepID=UPI001C8D4DEC|nr:FkbM family methyltransferase [Paracrocinitomix mangrovi]UKN01243.1 FkbM family methyltransferase [Paracrocinitomix mangrovi]